jgi:tape measure domain-containing protein
MATMNSLLTTTAIENVLISGEMNLAFNKMVGIFDDISYTIGSFTEDVSKGFKDYSNTINKLNEGIDKVNVKIAKDEAATQKKAKKSKSGITKLKNSFENAKKAVSSINFSSMKSGFDEMDKYNSANNKLEKIGGSQKGAEALKNKVYESANSTSTSYLDMAGAVSNISSLGSFKTDDESVNFIELMQKALKMDGSSQSLADVTKSMSDGSISGDEFSSLVSSAPTIGAAMSSATGMSMSELQKLAEQGMITADLLKNAMFSYGTEISSEFAKQPKTFDDIWTQVTNKVMNALSPLIQLFSNMINSSAFQGAINVIIAGLTYVTSLANSLIAFIMENGNVIKAILLALGAVLLVVLAASIASWFMMYLPIMLIVGAIALIIYILGELGVSFQDVFSFVGGLVGGLYAIFYNVFMGIWNIIASVVNFIVNAFSNTTNSVKIAINDLATSVFGVFAKIVKGIQDLINIIPGAEVDISSGFTNYVKSIEDENKNLKKDSGYKEILKTAEYLDISETASSGSQFASKTLTKAQDIFSSSSDQNKNIFDDNKFSLEDSGLGSSNSPLSTEITGSTGAVDVNMAEEDTQYLRDLAEREYINKFNTTSLSPNVSITFGDVHETADAEKVSKRIAQILREQIAVAAEGAY